MRLDFLMLALWWTAYCAFHSALISVRITGFFKRVLGARYCYYRLLFNAISLITLIPLLLYSRAPRFQDPLLFSWIGNWRIVGIFDRAAIVLLFRAALQHEPVSWNTAIRSNKARVD
jgi:hypothetical protein